MIAERVLLASLILVLLNLFSVNHGLEEGSAAFEIQDAITTTDANHCGYFLKRGR